MYYFQVQQAVKAGAKKLFIIVGVRGEVTVGTESDTLQEAKQAREEMKSKFGVTNVTIDVTWR